MKLKTLIAIALLIQACAAVADQDDYSCRVPSFYLPGILYAAPGLECNVYYKNIFNSVVPQNFAFQTKSKVGRARLNRWHWTPEAKDAGTTNDVIFYAWNDSGVVACLTTKVVVAAKPINPEKKFSFALFADSLTNARYPDTIRDDMVAAGCVNFKSVGTRGGPTKWSPDSVRHEGIPGYTCSQFLRHCGVTEEEVASAKNEEQRQLYLKLGKPKKIEDGWDRLWVRSPLIRLENARPVLDVQMWMDRVNGGKAPDVVMVQLGLNNVFWFTGEREALRRRIRKTVIPSYREFYKTLREKMPETRFVFTTQPIGTDQDAFGENYKSGWNEVQHRKNAFSLNMEIERFVRELNDPKVELLSLVQAIDPFYGFHHASHPVNARSKIKKDRATNAVHVSKTGGDQIADVMASWLLNRWNELTAK